MRFMVWQLLVYAVINLAGLVISVWAYRARRRLGYLLIAAHFLLSGCNSVYLSVIAPRIDAANFQRWSAEQPPPTEAENPRPIYNYNTAPRLPIGVSYLSMVVMVTGLWLVARDEHPRKVQPVDTPESGPTASVDDTKPTDGRLAELGRRAMKPTRKEEGSER